MAAGSPDYMNFSAEAKRSAGNRQFRLSEEKGSRTDDQQNSSVDRIYRQKAVRRSVDLQNTFENTPDRERGNARIPDPEGEPVCRYRLPHSKVKTINGDQTPKLKCS